jgi:hypothetical protein
MRLVACERSLDGGSMRLSRPAAVMFVLSGAASLTSQLACSSQSSGFGVGPDGSVPTDSTTVSKHDARPSRDVVATDVQTLQNNHHDAKEDHAVSHDAGFNDATVHVDALTCLADAGTPGPGPVKHTCIIYPAGADDDNECDGHHDLTGFPSNGTGGNGFDDNCNGLVDEGCTCDNVGTTKPCWLVPASQTVNGVPVGWCATNSKGTVDCAQHGEGTPTWSGNCRGAQPPYASDVCAPGDFNCDGKEENPTTGSCACVVQDVVCPTKPLTTVPYPPPSALPLEVNAATWFSNPANAASATNWSWTMTGGDCDNILPNPTFGLYPTSVGTGAPVGTTSTSLGSSGKEHGTVAVQPAVTSVVYPAFSLSGDYILIGSFDYKGTAYSCSLQIHVRAPGLRAEGCWSTEGQGDDVDLHMAKVNGFTQCATTHAWSDIKCPLQDEDCYYGDCYAGSYSGTSYTDDVNWGYTSSPAASCTGWGSQNTGTTCGNPRLDRDANGLSGICDPTLVNPNGTSANGPFCGPENINLDNPGNGDQFAVGIRFYTKNSPKADNAMTHVNLYCDGERVYAGGYDPVAGNNYPQLITAGEDGNPGVPIIKEGGDMWKVALVTTTIGNAAVDGGVDAAAGQADAGSGGDAGGNGLHCLVVPTQSKVPDPPRDGDAGPYCVDNATLNTANSQVYLVDGGGVPASANELCYH